MPGTEGTRGHGVAPGSGGMGTRGVGEGGGERRGPPCPYLVGPALQAGLGPGCSACCPASVCLFFLPQQPPRLRPDQQAAEGRVCVRRRASGERAAPEERGRDAGRRPASSAGTAAARASGPMGGWGQGAPWGPAALTPSPPPRCLAPRARSTGATRSGAAAGLSGRGQTCCRPGCPGRATGAGLGMQRQAGAQVPHARGTRCGRCGVSTSEGSGRSPHSAPRCAKRHPLHLPAPAGRSYSLASFDGQRAPPGGILGNSARAKRVLLRETGEDGD